MKPHEQPSFGYAEDVYSTVIERGVTIIQSRCYERMYNLLCGIVSEGRFDGSDVLELYERQLYDAVMWESMFKRLRDS